MINKILLSIPIITLIAIQAVPSYSGDRVIAAVGREPITHLEVMMVRSEFPNFTYSEAVDLLIERNLIIQWGRKNRVSVSDKELDDIINSMASRNNTTTEEFEKFIKSRGQTMDSYRERVREQLMITRAMSAALAEKIQVSNEEINDLYERDYPAKKTFTLSHILLRLPEGSSGKEEEQKRAEALSLLDRIRAGLPFAEAAGKYSDDSTSASSGGSLGTYTQGELLPALEKAVLTMKKGEVGGPARSHLGFHLVFLTDTGTTLEPLSEVRDKISLSLRMEKEKTARKRWLKELRKETYIEIFADEG
ncbi:MAG: peptidylprolyl isomerase [bacterium]